MLTFGIAFVFPVLPTWEALTFGRFSKMLPICFKCLIPYCSLGVVSFYWKEPYPKLLHSVCTLAKAFTICASHLIFCDSSWRCLVMITIWGWVKYLLNCLKDFNVWCFKMKCNFICLNYIYSELFEVDHIRTIYHMFIALLILFILSTLVVDYIDEGR